MLAFELAAHGLFVVAGVVVSVALCAPGKVNAAIAAGLVPEALQAGYTDTATRAQFCALAVELYETVTGSENGERAEFTDTTDVNVQKMAGIGVINGVGNGQFNPSGQLTREQADALAAEAVTLQFLPAS